MSNKIEVAIDVKSQAAIGAFAGLTASITSAGIGLIKAGIDAGIQAIGDSITLASDKAEAASKVNILYGEFRDGDREGIRNRRDDGRAVVGQVPGSGGQHRQPADQFRPDDRGGGGNDARA